MGDDFLSWYNNFWKPDDEQESSDEVADYNNATQDAEDIANESPKSDSTDSTVHHTWFWGSPDKENGS